VAITIDISDLITSVSVLIIGIMIAVVLWKTSQLVDAVKENIKEAKKA
jgi:uncharacterized protein YoxC